MIYLSVGYFKSVRRVLIFNRVRELILIETFRYIKKTPDRLLDLDQLQTQTYRRLKANKLIKWVKGLDITWATHDAIQYSFEFEYSAMSKKYKFVIGVEEFQKIVDEK